MNGMSVFIGVIFMMISILEYFICPVPAVALLFTVVGIVAICVGCME